jgi:hypothetical protein
MDGIAVNPKVSSAKMPKVKAQRERADICSSDGGNSGEDSVVADSVMVR